MSDLDDLTRRVREFAQARDWEQFHTPKNLSMALAGEVGGLLAEFQWLTEDTYKVLLRRGMMGTYVYAVDPETQEFFRELLG